MPDRIDRRATAVASSPRRSDDRLDSLPANVRDHQSVLLRRFAPRERIVQVGAPTGTIFELVRGVVVVTAPADDGRHRVVDIVRPGRFFGFTGHGRHRCTAVAATGVVVCCLDLATARRNDTVAARIEREMLSEIDRQRELRLLFGRGTAIERIVGFFAMQVSPEAPNVVHLPVMRREIAELLGLTVETVSRSLTRLKREGRLVEEGSGHWRIAEAPRHAAPRSRLVAANGAEGRE